MLPVVTICVRGVNRQTIHSNLRQALESFQFASLLLMLDAIVEINISSGAGHTFSYGLVLQLAVAGTSQYVRTSIKV